MSAPAQIGLYWGDNHFSIVENINGQIANIFQIPFDTPLSEDETESTPDELKFPALIEKTLAFRSVKTKVVNVAIPAHEILFRSFTIPFVDKKEVADIIEFEVTKYIPIKLEDLVYTYHTVAQVENGQKHLLALFIAVHRDFFKKVVETVDRAGLTLQNIEPAPVSLMHLLKRHNVIPKDKTTAVLEIGEESSEIIVIENDTLHFMRKLNIALSYSDLTTLVNSLQNETRVLFNFYNRQNQSRKIENLIVLSRHPVPGAVEILGKELGIPVSLISMDRFIPLEEFQTNAHAIAYGATLRSGKLSPKFFDLSERAIATQRSGRDMMDIVRQYSLLVRVIAGCAVTIAAVVMITNKFFARNEMRMEALRQKLGPYESFTIDDLNTQKQGVMDKLASYASVQVTSQVSLIVSEIPRILSEGMWLTGFQITSENPGAEDVKKIRFKIILTGKIYSLDPNNNINILNQFISSLQNNAIMNGFYNEVKRESTSQGREDGHIITVFSITCS